MHKKSPAILTTPYHSEPPPAILNPLVVIPNLPPVILNEVKNLASHWHEQHGHEAGPLP